MLEYDSRDPIAKPPFTFTYSVDSTAGVVGMIIRMQLVKMVVMMNNENNG